jgi:hypothetical protein
MQQLESFTFNAGDIFSKIPLALKAELIDLPAGYYSLRNHEARFVEGKIYRVMLGNANPMRVVLENDVVKMQRFDGCITTMQRRVFWELLMNTPTHLRAMTDDEANQVSISGTGQYFSQEHIGFVCVRRMLRCFLIEQCLALRETHQHNHKYSMSFMTHLKKAYELSSIDPASGLFSTARQLKAWDLKHQHQIDVMLDPIWLAVRELMGPVLDWTYKLTKNYLNHVHQIDLAGNTFVLRRGPDHRALLWEMSKMISNIEE